MKFLITLALLIGSISLSAQWFEKGNGVNGANIQTLISDGTNLFTGTTNGVYRSTDNGVTWTAANTGMVNGHVNSLAAIGANLFAGVDDAQGPIPGGVYLSTNSGASWTQVNTGLTSLRVNGLAANGGNLFAGTIGGGMFLSTNNGASWSAVNTGITNLDVIKVFVSGGNLFASTFAGAGNGLFLSTNNGASWTNVDPSPGSPVYAMTAIGGNLFAGGNGVFLSTNNGASWTPVNTGLSGATNVRALAANGVNLFAGTSVGGVSLSTNNGTSWAPVNTGITTSSIQSLGAIGGNLYAGTFGSLFKSTNNGSNWTAINTGLSNTLPYDIEVVAGKMYTGSNAGVHLSTNNGTTWTTLNTGLTNTIVFDLAISGTNLFAGTYGGGVFLSTDNGMNWSAVNSGLTGLYITSLLASGTNLFAGTQNEGVFLSTNNGLSWAPVNSGLTTLSVLKLVSSGGDLFAGTFFGGCFRSTNNGASWTAVNTGLTNTVVQTLAVMGTTLFAGTWGGVFKSTNNGANWTAINNGLSPTALFWNYDLTVVGTYVITAALDGIYLSADNGANWTNISAGLSDIEAESLAESGGELFAGVIGRNVWARPVTELGFSLAPAIASFSPSIGNIGTTVTITGSNFSATSSDNIVYFGATQATVTTATTTQLTVTVPSGATYQPITVSVGGLTAYSAKPFLVTFAGGGNIDPCSFSPKVDFTTGAGPFGITMADFDGDGKIDLAIANRFIATITVYRNISTIGSISTGSFATPISLPTGTGDPYSLTSGDLDSDGKLDIIITRAGVSQVSIYRNTSAVGSLSFDSKVDFVTGLDALKAVIGDLDGDGKPEIAVSNRYSGTISIFKNTTSSGGFTSGSFAPKVDFVAGTEPYNLAIADLDDDGKPDIANVNNLDNSVSVYKNTTTIGVINTSSFAAKVDFMTGLNPLAVVVSDIDNDNKIDIVVSNNNGTVSILKNIGTGGIVAGSFATKVDFATGSGSYLLSLTDLDGDGRPDIITPNLSSNTVSVLRNLSSPGTINTTSFATKVDFSVGNRPLATAIGDLDADGKPEFVVTNDLSNSFSIFRNIIGILPPTISSFNPIGGTVGTLVTISGANFDPILANNVVRVNGVITTASSGTVTSLTVLVPVGATTGFIDVTIGCNTVPTSSNFTVCTTPSAPGAIDGSGCGPGSIMLQATGASAGEYRWYAVPTGGTPEGGAINAIFSTPSISATTTYHASIINTVFCESTRTPVTATVIPLPLAPSALAPPPLCAGSAVSVTASGASDGDYRWYDGATPLTGEVNSILPIPSLSVTKTYSVAIFDGTCESLQTNVVATVQPCSPPVIGSNVSVPFVPGIIRIDLTPLLSDPENNIDLSTLIIVSGLPSGATATIEGTELVINYNGIPFPGQETIVLRVCDLTGQCSDDTTLTINLSSEITVFNAISPNGDGKNDDMEIENIDKLPETKDNKFTLFNRLGIVVFEATNYDNGANAFKGLGKNGEELPTGTYFYTIEFTSGAPKRSGFIAVKK